MGYGDNNQFNQQGNFAGGDIKHVIDTVARLNDPKLVEIKPVVEGAPSAQVLVAPAGLQIHDVSKFTDEQLKHLPQPERKRGTAKLTSIESFVAHVNRNKDKDSAVFADTDGTKPALLAVYDYNSPTVLGTNTARWGEHRARYEFPLSKEWQAWQEHNDKGMGQTEFAQFLEDRIADVADPSNANDAVKELLTKIECELAGPAKLMEVSRGLSVRIDTKVSNAVRLSSGEVQFTFVEEHKDTNGSVLKVPGAFLLTIPIFQGGALYRIPVRLRYRAREGRITWFYSLYRTQETFDHAVKEAMGKVAKETDLPVFEGFPEAR